MSSQKTKFLDKEIDKKEFYSTKEAIFLDSVELSKIFVSNKCKISDTKYKYFCGYLNSNVIQSSCVILPQMGGRIKYFDDSRKNMSFIMNDKKVYERYNGIWNIIKKLLKIKFTVSPARDDKYIITKLKIFKDANVTTFTDNVMPIENIYCTCISAIDIDSVLKIDKKTFTQAYLEQYKYKLMRKKRARYIDHLKVIDYDSENDSDSDNEIKNDNENKIKSRDEIENLSLFR